MKRLFFALLLLAVLGAGGLGLWVQARSFLGTPVTPPGGHAELTIAPGTSLARLGAQLDAKGVIQDVHLPLVGSLFYLWAHHVEHAGASIKAGEYLFEGPATPRQVLAIVRRGQVRTYHVTIPEGLRLDEIMPLFEAAGIARAKDLLAKARDPAFVHTLGIDADTLEGYVFPETYTFARGLSPEAILRRTVQRFNEAFDRATRGSKPPMALSRHQITTLASIVEKETGAPEERPHIACVFYNRLREGWKLQTDPTVIYAKILWSGGHWDGNLTRADLEHDHPYNTYTRKGLPPGPIASPGAAALEAVMHPMACDDFFFVARGNGTHVFCKDYACHLRAVERFQRAGRHRP